MVWGSLCFKRILQGRILIWLQRNNQIQFLVDLLLYRLSVGVIELILPYNARTKGWAKRKVQFQLGSFDVRGEISSGCIHLAILLCTCTLLYSFKRLITNSAKLGFQMLHCVWLNLIKIFYYDYNTNCLLIEIFRKRNDHLRLYSKSSSTVTLTSIVEKGWITTSLPGIWYPILIDRLGPGLFMDYFNCNKEKFTALTCLNLENCVVHWTTVLDVLGFLQLLNKFEFRWVDKTNEGGPFMGEHISLVMRGLDRELVLQKADMWDKKYSEEALKQVSSIKHVTIHVPFLQVLNTLIKVVELRCDCLESLDLAVDGERMNETSIKIPGRMRCTLAARWLLLKNISTLKEFSFGFRPKWISENPQKDFKTTLYTIGMLETFLELNSLRLKIFKLKFHLHMNPVLSDNDASTLNKPDRRKRHVKAAAFRARAKAFKMLKSFMKSQKRTLKLITIDGLQIFGGAEKLTDRRVIGNANLRLKKIFVGLDPDSVRKWEVWMRHHRVEFSDLCWQSGQSYKCGSVKKETLLDLTNKITTCTGL